MEKNIQDLQILIVKRCIQVYKFVDYFHDKRRNVPLKYIHSQQPPYILNALFLKMKADYMLYIYECLSGDNGLLKDKIDELVDIRDDIEQRKLDALKVHDETIEIVDSEIYYTLYPSDGNKNTFKDP